MRESSFEALGTHLRKIKNCVQKKINDAVNKYDISSVHANYILLLYKCEGLTFKEVNNIIEVDKANTTRVINDLLKKEIIYKTDDVRKYKVYLTDKGQKIAGAIEKEMDKLKMILLKNISEEEAQNFAKVFLKILDNLKEE